MAKHRARRDLKKESRWREIVDRQRVSGMSIRGWCRDQGVQEATFHWWRRELARRDAEMQAASFMPVHVTDAPVRDGDSLIEIALADGRRVRVTGVANCQALTNVLDVLERRAC
jgi:transposase